jgi:hypothetical protein
LHLNAHARPEFLGASPDVRNSVDNYQAGRTVANSTEEAAWAASLQALVEYLDTCCVKSAGYWFSFVSLKLLTFPVELDLSPFGEVKYGMLFDPDIRGFQRPVPPFPKG